MPSPPESGEDAKIALLARILGAPPAGVSLGIGDDAAVIEPGNDPLVWSIDTAHEGVHFTRALMSLEDAAYRATTAALSDLAAMGAAPIGVLAALSLPRDVTREDLEAIARGQRDAAARVATSIVGGNLTRADAISITTTVLGRAKRPLTRSGALPGDVLWLAGPVGLAGAGLAAARRGQGPVSEAIGAALTAFKRPVARMGAGLAAAASGATSAVDVSDGTAQDAARLATASGVDVLLSEAKLVDATLAQVAAELGLDARALALGGGEDYALLVTAPPGEDLTGPGFRVLGRCVAPRETPGAWVEQADGSLVPATGGWDHFG